MMPPAPFWPELLHDLGFTVKALLLNILVLPLYLVPVLNLVLFYWLNGRLLGREYFVMDKCGCRRKYCHKHRVPAAQCV